MGNGYFTVCGIIEIEGKILLVRHTYGTAKDRILVPGGYVEENELPNIAIEREIFEETSVTVKAKELLAIQFKTNQWCPVFICEYISGTPKCDNYENSEVLLLDIDEAIKRDDITNMSRELLKIYKSNKEKRFPCKEHNRRKLCFVWMKGVILNEQNTCNNHRAARCWKDDCRARA